MIKRVHQYSCVTIALLSFTSRAQPVNDNFADRIAIQPNVPFIATLPGATLQPSEPLPTSHPSQNLGSAWWSWTPSITGFATITDTKETYPTSWPHALAVYEGDNFPSLANPTWTYMTPSYDSTKGGFRAFLGFRTTAGLPLSIGMLGQSSAFQHNFVLTVSETPIIIEHPTSQTLPAGAAATFRFISPGFAGGRAQWQFNSQDIPNATNAVLPLTNIRASHAGEYRVIIDATNAAGVLKRTISASATLTVLGDVIPSTLSLEHASASSDTFELKIAGASKHWYSVYSTSDFLTWQRVPIEIWETTTPATNRVRIPAIHAAEFLRVEHKGDIVQTCVQNLRQIHFAKEMLRVTHKILPGSNMNPADAKQFLGELPLCPQGAAYWYGPFGSYPVCPVADHYEP